MLYGGEEMKVNVQLGSNSLAKSSLDEPIILPEKELELCFESDIYQLENIKLMVTIRNRMTGDQNQFKTDVEQGHIVDISEALECGELEVEISSYIIDGSTTKTWRIPNIVLRQVDAQFEIIPELEELRRAFGEIKTILEKNNLL